jgi:hypothetical protein
MTEVKFAINTNGPQQTKFTKWYATPSDGTKAFLVGYTTVYSDGDGPHIGLNSIRYLAEMPRLYFDRQNSAAETETLWAHFMWPTVCAESLGGHHLLINTYDRARFTFGFYQLAAHTPNDNLILLFRRLLELPKAEHYFPDLQLNNGIVHRLVDRNLKSLEIVSSILRPNGKTEDQIVGFMNYLNPDTNTIGNNEVVNAARLQHWLLNDSSAMKASVEIAMKIMKSKVRNLLTKYPILSDDFRLAIWVSDIVHQGRASKGEISSALLIPSLSDKLVALSQIGSSNADYDSRRNLVRDKIEILLSEGIFDGVAVGDALLPF